MFVCVWEKLYILRFAMMESKFAEGRVEGMDFLIILAFQIF